MRLALRYALLAVARACIRASAWLDDDELLAHPQLRELDDELDRIAGV